MFLNYKRRFDVNYKILDSMVYELHKEIIDPIKNLHFSIVYQSLKFDNNENDFHLNSNGNKVNHITLNLERNEYLSKNIFETLLRRTSRDNFYAKKASYFLNKLVDPNTWGIELDEEEKRAHNLFKEITIRPIEKLLEEDFNFYQAQKDFTIQEGFIMEGKSEFLKNKMVFDSELDYLYRIEFLDNEEEKHFLLDEKYYCLIIFIGWIANMRFHNINKSPEFFLDRSFLSHKCFSELIPSKNNSDKTQNDNGFCDKKVFEYFNMLGLKRGKIMFNILDHEENMPYPFYLPKRRMETYIYPSNQYLTISAHAFYSKLLCLAIEEYPRIENPDIIFRFIKDYKYASEKFTNNLKVLIANYFKMVGVKQNLYELESNLPICVKSIISTKKILENINENENSSEVIRNYLDSISSFLSR